MAFAACILAALAACSPSPDASGGANAAGEAARPRAKWPLPPETVQANETAQVEAANEQAADPKAANTAAATARLDSKDLATYRARGTEPFWAVTVIGGTLVLDTPGKSSRYFSVTPSTRGGTLRYTGEGIQLSSTPGPCNDGMSERVYGDRVQISLSDGVLKGCGSARSGRQDAG